MSILTLNDGSFDISNNKFNVYESNVVLTQNYGIAGGITEISSNMFNIINSNVNISRNNPYLGLNNTWLGTNAFKGDISFINTNTLIKSLNTINLSGGAINISGGSVNISGGPVNIGAAKLTTLDVSGSALLSGATTVSGTTTVSGNATFNNATTQINSTGIISLSGGIVNICGDIINICGGVINIKGSSTFGNSLSGTGWSIGATGNAAFNNATTQISSTGVVGLSGGLINISGGTVNIGSGNTNIVGPTTFGQNTYVLGGVGIGKNSVSSGYALDVSGSAIINNGKVGIGKTSPTVALDVSGSIQLSNTTGNGGAGVNTVITSNNGSFGSIECFNNANINSSSKLPLILQGYGGNVGIGNGMTNPSNTLDVSGVIKGNNNIYSNNLLLQGDGTNAYIRPINGSSTLYLGANTTSSLAINETSVNISSGKLSISDSTTYQTIGMKLDNTSVSNGGFQLSMSGSNGWSSSNTYGIYSNKMGTFPFVLNGDTGRVGIGKTSPIVALDVSGSLQLSNTAANVNTFITSHNGTFGSIECFGAQNTSKLPLILQGYGGNVGIGNGMTNPSNTLDVTGTIKASSTIYSNNLLLQGDGTDAYIRPTNSPSKLYLGTNNTAAHLTIDSAGSVGIGTTGPGSKLDVAGTILTDKMLLRTSEYNTLLTTMTYAAGTWYTAINPGILAADCVYIITLKFTTTSSTAPWNLHASFLNFCSVANSGSNAISGAAVPTSVHDGQGIDYQISVRGKIGSNTTSGVEFKINQATNGNGYWDVKAYRII